MEFRNQQLFGGAIGMEIPSDYYDVSSLRQVPDHQEVFQEKDGFDSVIVEILEYVGNVNAAGAARFHLEDYADVGSEGQLKIWSAEEIKMPHLPDKPVVAMLATTPPDQAGKIVGIFLLLVRLESHDTDMLITMNLKDVTTEDATEYSALFIEDANPAFRQGKDIVQHIIDSFEIKDFGLFRPEGN